MPKSDEPTDGNTKQWDKLKAMRSKRDGDAPEGTPAGGPAAASRDTGVITDPAVIEEAKRLREGGTAGGAADDDAPETDDETTPETPDAPDADDDDDDDDEPETVTVAAHERKRPTPKVDLPAPPPGHEYVAMDGKQVLVESSLAEAFRDSEQRRADTAKNAERDELVTTVVDRVKELLPQRDPAAEAAAKALADAEKAVEKPLAHPMPPSALSISDPDEYNKQLQLHIDEKSARAAEKAIADKEARETAARQTTQAAEEQRQIAWAKEQLGIQFYRKFKVLDDPAVKPLVDVLLDQKFNEVIQSGVLAKPGTPAEREALKERAFNDVAAAATKKIVDIRGKNTAAPATPTPPAVATGASGRGRTAPKPKEPERKTKERYPKSSVSSWLKDHQDRKSGRKTA